MTEGTHVTITAALVTGKGRLDLVEFPDPTPDPGGVVVDIAYCGICGTDLHAYQSGNPYNPAICGHEWAGTVSAAAADVERFAEGDRVAVAVPPACGSCEACRTGNTTWCETVFAAATGRDAGAPPHGGFAPSIAVPAGRLVHVPDSLDDIDGALLEPATVCVHGVRRAGIRLGDLVVIVGAGPIGLLTLGGARIAGAGRTVVVEPNPARRELALSIGADHAVDPDGAGELVAELSRGQLADVVFECAGLGPTVQASADLTRRGGTLVLVGVASGTATIIPALWVVKELNVEAAIAYTHDDFDLTIDLIATGRLPVKPLHDQTTDLAGLGEVFEDLAGGASQRTKVLVDPRT
ncbi:MAG: zinc-binding dehydrogenase [Actinomycetota bacterium]